MIAIKKLWKLLSFVGTVVLISFMLYQLEIFHAIRNGELKEFTAYYRNNEIYALILSLIIMIIQNSFTVIPLILVITINYYAFGFFYGFMWSWISSIVAAIIVFVAVRYWLQDFVQKKAHGEALRKIENKGGQYVFYARVLPFFPTSILNILAAVTTISLKGFVAGTAAGNFLYFFVLSLIPFGFLSTDINPILIVLIILAVTVVVYFIQKQKKVKAKAANNE